MGFSRKTDEYVDGVDASFNFTFDKSYNYDDIVCPCKTCNNVLWQPREEIRES